MRKRLIVALLALALAGCGGSAPTATAVPDLEPMATPLATLAPQPAVSPTPTAFGEGFLVPVRPDPSLGCSGEHGWFFENPAEECPTIVSNIWGVMQHFERGLMVWFQDGGRTYILLEDRSLFKPYQEAADPGSGPLPDPDPNLVPPPGRYQPVLGFGKFWRGLVPGYEWVRERLGWATAPEVGYSAFWQCNTASDDAARCYFSGPRNEVIVLARSQARYWNYWQGPVR